MSPAQTYAIRMARGPSALTLKNIWWKWLRGATRADCVARFHCLAVTFFELAQRNARNVTQLAMVVGVSDYFAPCHGKTTICFASVRRRSTRHLSDGLSSLATQLQQFRTSRLRVGVTAKSDQRNCYQGWHMCSHRKIPHAKAHLHRATINQGS